MGTEVSRLEPVEVWSNFYKLTRVPRPSKEEAQITRKMREFGESLGLETLVDNAGNVIIRKGATPGYEDRSGVILQAHLDMVPQKNSDTEHDFSKDPIDAYVDGDLVRARGTTLGADNGMGVAAAMAVLESKELEHGPVEALFTVDEETGMTGAIALESGVLQGDILMNLDSETEGELYVGCAGGLDATLRLPLSWESVGGDRELYRVSVKGLLGGHSGMDIVLGRANSIKLAVRLLVSLAELDPRVVTFEGGSLRNAIPREAFLTVSLPKGNGAEFVEGVRAQCGVYRSEFALADGGIDVSAEPGHFEGDTSRMLTRDSHDRLVRTLFVLPNGVIRMSNSLEGLVETSTNLAKVVVKGDEMVGQCLLRSSVESAKEALSQKIGAVLLLAGGSAEFDNGYPGWEPNMDSPILATMRRVYTERWGKEPAIMAIHAGLECGILGGAYPNWDMISFGPTIMSPHSPDERVDIASVGKFWEFLCLVLKNVPVKK